MPLSHSGQDCDAGDMGAEATIRLCFHTSPSPSPSIPTLSTPTMQVHHVEGS